MPCSEPTHDSTPRTTTTSQAEGRLKVGITTKKKRQILKKVLNKKNYG